MKIAHTEETVPSSLAAESEENASYDSENDKTNSTR